MKPFFSSVISTVYHNCLGMLLCIYFLVSFTVPLSKKFLYMNGTFEWKLFLESRPRLLNDFWYMKYHLIIWVIRIRHDQQFINKFRINLEIKLLN